MPQEISRKTLITPLKKINVTSTHFPAIIFLKCSISIMKHRRYIVCDNIGNECPKLCNCVMVIAFTSRNFKMSPARDVYNEQIIKMAKVKKRKKQKKEQKECKCEPKMC